MPTKAQENEHSEVHPRCGAHASLGASRQLLSVVVTIVDGGERLERCLRALAQQDGDVDLEVLVPFDDTVALSDMPSRFPDVRFLPLGELATARDARSARGQHELFDRRRAAGLAAAAGDLIAILEDRGAPRRDWATAVLAAHGASDGVIGGAIENVNQGTLNWAVYLCDFARYQLPLQKRVARYVSDTNVCYKRATVEATREIWMKRYHETTLHWALQRRGEALVLASGMVVEQDRGKLRLSELIEERIGHGRLFAYTRARELGLTHRALRVMTTPALPFVLFARIARMQWRRPTFGKFVRATPAIGLLLCAWSAGEALGYLTNRA